MRRSVDDLPALAEKFAADLAALDAGEARLVALGKAREPAEAHYRACAAALTKARLKAVKALDSAVTAELAPLKLERAIFTAQVVTDEAQAGPEGAERVEFWVQTNPGSRPGPLMKVASGGELSRFMLALKVVLADRGSAPTLVFDEIDSGAGGAAADAIGQRLARLGARVQVLSVTHAPQVAARADDPYADLQGSRRQGRARRHPVAPLVDDHRREEIARMLAGATITEEARAAAARLIENARIEPAKKCRLVLTHEQERRIFARARASTTAARRGNRRA